MDWCSLDNEEYINLEETLFSGQVFHFKRIGNDVYAGVLNNIVVVLEQRGTDIFYLNTAPGVKHSIQKFFNLDIKVNLPNEKQGLRFLTNDIYPTIFSFICSSNNNIKRITTMVDFLYRQGEQAMVKVPSIGTISESDSGVKELQSPITLYKFPPLSILIGMESELVKNKFGYRAKYICAAAKYLHNINMEWHNISYEEARAHLIEVPGIGRKIADCICLISLRLFHVVPIDTHIFKYSKEAFKLQIKSLNKSTYALIQQEWIARYGNHAGIAQLYVFKAMVDARAK